MAYTAKTMTVSTIKIARSVISEYVKKTSQVIDEVLWTYKRAKWLLWINDFSLQFVILYLF
jgi:hypothetical protein